MLNVDQKNRLHNTVSEMAELVLIKSCITETNKQKTPQPTTNPHNLKQRLAKLKETENKALSWKTLSNFEA